MQKSVFCPRRNSSPAAITGVAMKIWSVRWLVAITSNFSPIFNTTTSPSSVARYNLPFAPTGDAFRLAALRQSSLCVVRLTSRRVEGADHSVVSDDVEFVVVEHGRGGVGHSSRVTPNNRVRSSQVALLAEFDRHEFRIAMTAHHVDHSVLINRNRNRVRTQVRLIPRALSRSPDRSCELCLSR